MTHKVYQYGTFFYFDVSGRDQGRKRKMNIYVDYDDCLCETARAFTVIAERLFGKTVPYETVRFFNLQDSFELTDEEYELLMLEGHRPEVLLSYEETPGASRVLNEWIDLGQLHVTECVNNILFVKR